MLAELSLKPSASRFKGVAASPTCLHVHKPMSHPLALKHRRHPTRVRAASDPDDATNIPEKLLAIVPAKPKSPVGEMLAYYFKEAPHLLRPAIEDQFQRLAGAREKAQQQPQQGVEGTDTPSEGADLVLYRRMEQLKAAEERAMVEDLMYVSILEKFATLGVDMLPRIDDYVHTETPSNLKVLMDGVHSRDAVELVKEHVLSVLGPASMAFSNTMIKMSKLQGAQVYAASLMFGYFLRRVDKRFQLEKAMGTLAELPEDAVNRLNRLLAQADSIDESDDPDGAKPADPLYRRGRGGGRGVEGDIGGVDTDPSGPKRRNRLRQYVEQFDQQTLLETARVVSLEGAAVIEHQVNALFGDIKELQAQMQRAVGEDASSMDEVMQRIQSAVAAGSVDSLTMTVGTQRRAVLEAVAFGAFLRDVETHVDNEYQLLTNVPPSPGGPGGPGLLT